MGRRSGRPREIGVWFTCLDGRYYLIAETGERAHWVQNLAEDPQVRVGLDGRELPARARVVDRVTETRLHDAAAALSTAKYGWGDGLVVELTPDPGA